eukprot:Sspe_Gene.62731::Locus_35420_Transcript_3_3_Confidence_0.500_Length_1069::g.62731::m.62731
MCTDGSISRSSLAQHLSSLVGRRRFNPENLASPQWMASFSESIVQQSQSESILESDAPGLLFESLTLPPISLHNYIWLLWAGFRSYGSSSASWVSSIILLRRFVRTGHTPLTAHTVHRLVLTALVVASKVVDDYSPCNAFAAALGGVDLENLNAMERTFLLALNFDVNISQEEYMEEVPFFHRPGCITSPAVSPAGSSLSNSTSGLTPTSSSTSCTSNSPVSPVLSPVFDVTPKKRGLTKAKSFISRISSIIRPRKAVA